MAFTNLHHNSPCLEFVSAPNVITTLLTSVVSIRVLFLSAPLLSAPELRVFPERYVVCVSCPEDASAHHGNPSPAAVSAVYTPLFPPPVAWQKKRKKERKKQHGSVCYYRDALPKLCSHCIWALFTQGGPWTCRGGAGLQV